MADNITRCPKCHTSFRITEAHLKSAKGAVRCGSCLHVFNARENLIAVAEHQAKTKPATQKPLTNKPLTSQPRTNQHQTSTAKEAPSQAFAAETTAASAIQDASPQASSSHPLTQPTGAGRKPEPAPVAKTVEEPKTIEETKPLIDDDDFLISDDMATDEPDASHASQDDFDSDFNDNMFYAKSAPHHESNLFERKKNDDEDDDDEKSDESWALNLLDDEEEFPKIMKDTGQYKAVPSQDNDSGIDEQESDAAEETFSAEFEQSVFSDSIDEKYEEMSNDQLQEELEEEMRKTGYQEPVFTSAEPSLADLESLVEPDYGEAASGNTGKQYIHAIEPEPVEFSYKRDYSFFESRLLWWSLISLMAVALFAQIAWLQFDQLNRIEPYRSYYASACKFIGCKLPPLVSLNEIKAVNLVVRSHPENDNALIVDAVLQNAAAFPQSFPALDLIFTDSQDKPVAARRFQPGEYLGGELAGRKDMPSQQPIHIALEIVDPGPNAVGYKIAIAH